MTDDHSPLRGRRIIVGVSGGIAAYKTPLLVRLLVKAGAEVKCAVTEHALLFVTEMTLETVSSHSVYTGLFNRSNAHSTEHIALKDWADAIIVAPATANIIGKLASGIGDDALSTLLLAFRKPIFMAEAMNTQMLLCPSVQRNMTVLQNDGVTFIDGAAGELACGAYGNGRMAEPEDIVSYVEHFFSKSQSFAGRSILVTAGPTYEKIDSVRFIGNFSTGKMGFAIAEELACRGAHVVLITGPTSLSTHNSGIERIEITSAQEMYDAATTRFPQCDAAILTAAVADFRPAVQADHKIKKVNDTDGMTLTLVQNPDILASLGRMKTGNQLLVGFALETDNELQNAKKKLQRKNLDFIVLNSLNDKGAGFGTDTNKVTMIDCNGAIDEGQLKSKQAVAADIADKLQSMFTA